MSKPSKKKPLSERDLANASRLKLLWDENKEGLKLTQTIAADLMGFETQGAVSHYLNGKAALNTEAVIKFSTVLKVTPEEINPDFDYGYRSSGTASSELSAMTGVGVISSGSYIAQKFAREMEEASESGKINDEQIKQLSAMVKIFTEDK